MSYIVIYADHLNIHVKIELKNYEDNIINHNIQVLIVCI